MNTKEMIAEYQRRISVMEGFENGEEIEYKFNNGEEWFLVKNQNLTLNWEESDYRLKPREPRVIHVNEYNGESFGAHRSKDAAITAAYNTVRTAVKYIEVIDDE